MKNYLIVDSQQFDYNTYNHIVDSHLQTVFESSLYGASFGDVPQKANAVKRTPYRFDYICCEQDGMLMLESNNNQLIDLRLQEVCDHIFNGNSNLNWVSIGNKFNDNELQWFYRSNNDRLFRSLFTDELINNGNDFLLDNLVHIYQPIKGIRLFYVLFNFQRIMISDVEVDNDRVAIDYCDFHNATLREMIYFPRWKQCFENSNIIITQRDSFSVDLFEKCGYNIKKKQFDFSKLPVKIKTDLKYKKIGVGKYKFSMSSNIGFIYITIPTQLGGSQDDSINIQQTYLVYKRGNYENN